MQPELTKSFPFSASYESEGRAVGRNFTLWVTVDALEEGAEREFEAVIERELVSKLHTRDLSQHVDFLKGVPIRDTELLRVFWGRLSKPLAPYHLKRLALQRDARTMTTFHG